MPEREEEQLTPHQRAIIGVMLGAQRPLSTKQVAEISKISWTSTKRNLKILEEKGIVSSESHKPRRFQRKGRVIQTESKVDWKIRSV